MRESKHTARLIILAVILVFFLVAVVTARSAASWNECSLYRGVYQVQCLSVRRAVYAVWGFEAPAAMRVAACETGRTWNVWATNGQYWGVFQMGSHERATYGFAWNVWEQARGAHRYWSRAGWSPWAQCR
jgi:hypothetical protein